MKTLIIFFLFALSSSLQVQAQDQSGFISLDCGLLPSNSTYTEPTTKLNYISDAPYISTGLSKPISTQFKGDFQRQTWNLRSFPTGTRNCYTIPIPKAPRYLIRATFVYGNYDGLNNPPEFDLYFGANLWDKISFTDGSSVAIKEIIHVPTTSYVHICFVNIGKGIPFVSALEFRSLSNDSYQTVSGSLALYSRLDLGSTTNLTYRYDKDVYDRIWTPFSDPTWTQVSTPLAVDAAYHASYQPASVVMSTAATLVNPNASWFIYWEPNDNGTTRYYVYMHFAEVVKLEAIEFRGFNITYNGKYWYGPLIPDYLFTTTVYSTSALYGSNVYNFSLVRIENSTLPPIMNAIEIYRVIDLQQPETDQGDVDAIEGIKSAYGVTRDWEGDPCTPTGFPWNGLNCSYDATPRITTLNLSSSGLNGSISFSLSNLAMLQVLDLSNNNLTGAVPSFLSNLSHLKVLNLEQNMLTGTIPFDLINKARDGSLSLRVGNNPNLDTCALNSCKKKKKKTSPVIPIVAVVGGLLVIFIISGAIYWRITRPNHIEQAKGHKDATSEISNHQTERSIPHTIDSSMETRGRRFTYSEVLKITDNFRRVLGEGGFGKVFHGFIDDIEVAVKVLSPSAARGFQQFQAEVQTLMRVHHRNLTSLVGFLNEGPQIGLIYEYMAGGNLHEHLSGSSLYVLSWADRVRIAVDAALGLEYLHHGSKPPIVHRDVKTSNILLTENLQGKLSDFGLSKSFTTDGDTHVSTNIIAGTPGYLDPEYYISYRLTEKSDVYSFGVTLLEIITCEPVISKKHQRGGHISQWVESMLAQGDIRRIVDPRLRGDFDVNSVWKAVETAMVCVNVSPSKRPDMSQVVADLKDCLALELAGKKDGGRFDSTDSIDIIPAGMTSEFGPKPR